MYFVTRIDVAKFSKISNRILTDEVIITEERLKHIALRRGEDFLPKYQKYFPLILSDPDYIFPDDRPNTAIVCKIVGEGSDAVNLILRLTVEGEDPGYKNSILTAIKESDHRFAQRIRNNEAVYKKVDNR